MKRSWPTPRSDNVEAVQMDTPWVSEAARAYRAAGFRQPFERGGKRRSNGSTWDTPLVAAVAAHGSLSLSPGWVETLMGFPMGWTEV